MEAIVRSLTGIPIVGEIAQIIGGIFKSFVEKIWVVPNRRLLLILVIAVVCVLSFGIYQCQKRGVLTAGFNKEEVKMQKKERFAL